MRANNIFRDANEDILQLESDKINDAFNGNLLTSIISPKSNMDAYSNHVSDGRAEEAYGIQKLKWLCKIKKDYPGYQLTAIDYENAHLIIKNEFFNGSHNERIGNAYKFHYGDITRADYFKIINDDVNGYQRDFFEFLCSDSLKKISPASIGLAYFSSLICFEFSVPLALHGPLAVEILRNISEENDVRGVELMKMFYMTSWLAAMDILIDEIVPKKVSRTIGEKGGRPSHSRQSEALMMAEMLIAKNKGVSLSEVSEDIFVVLRSKYNDYPKLPTIRKWVYKLEHYSK